MSKKKKQSRKEQTIKACKELRKKYLDPKEKIFFDANFCSLCSIHTSNGCDCKGCPLANKHGDGGCFEFKSGRKADASCKNGYPKRKKPNKAFVARADFFKKIIPILRKIPARRFTESGWTYFYELDRNW